MAMAEVLSASEIQKDVDAYNAVYGDMDRVLWCLAKHARADLLRGQSTATVTALVCAIKEWWGIPYAPSSICVITTGALIRQTWNEGLFDDRFDPRGERFAVERVEHLVEGMFKAGSGSRELSLASKTLHWLMPWRVPVYDRYVRDHLGIADPSDSKGANRAYREILRHAFRTARRHSDGNPRWLGETDHE